MSKKKILLEGDCIPFKFNLHESEGGKLTASGVFSQCDVPNQNKRVYPRSLWERVVNSRDIQEAIKARKLVGHLEHPSSGRTDLREGSHLVTALYLGEDASDPNVYGTLEVLNTKRGHDLRAYLEDRVAIGVSSRGSGTVESSKGGVDLVSPGDYEYKVHDVVADPSVISALPEMDSDEEDDKEDDLKERSKTPVYESYGTYAVPLCCDESCLVESAGNIYTDGWSFQSGRIYRRGDLAKGVKYVLVDSGNGEGIMTIMYEAKNYIALHNATLVDKHLRKTLVSEVKIPIIDNNNSVGGSNSMDKETKEKRASVNEELKSIKSVVEAVNVDLGYDKVDNVLTDAQLKLGDLLGESMSFSPAAQSINDMISRKREEARKREESKKHTKVRKSISEDEDPDDDEEKGSDDEDQVEETWKAKYKKLEREYNAACDLCGNLAEKNDRLVLDNKKLKEHVKGMNRAFRVIKEMRGIIQNQSKAYNKIRKAYTERDQRLKKAAGIFEQFKREYRKLEKKYNVGVKVFDSIKGKKTRLPESRSEGLKAVEKMKYWDSVLHAGSSPKTRKQIAESSGFGSRISKGYFGGK